MNLTTFVTVVGPQLKFWFGALSGSYCEFGGCWVVAVYIPPPYLDPTCDAADNPELICTAWWRSESELPRGRIGLGVGVAPDEASRTDVPGVPDVELRGPADVGER